MIDRLSNTQDCRSATPYGHSICAGFRDPLVLVPSFTLLDASLVRSRDGPQIAPSRPHINSWSYRLPFAVRTDSRLAPPHSFQGFRGAPGGSLKLNFGYAHIALNSSLFPPSIAYRPRYNPIPRRLHTLKTLEKQTIEGIDHPSQASQSYIPPPT